MRMKGGPSLNGCLWKLIAGDHWSESTGLREVLFDRISLPCIFIELSPGKQGLSVCWVNLQDGIEILNCHGRLLQLLINFTSEKI